MIDDGIIYLERVLEVAKLAVLDARVVPGEHNIHTVSRDAHML